MKRQFLGGCILSIALLYTLTPRSASAQFFNPGATSFTPEIGVVYSGVSNDVQATVSADRKYVTMTMRPQSSQLLNLRSFTFQVGAGGGAGGLVGGAGAGAVKVGAAKTVAPAQPAAPAPAAPNPLDRSGMTRVSG